MMLGGGLHLWKKMVLLSYKPVHGWTSAARFPFRDEHQKPWNLKASDFCQ